MPPPSPPAAQKDLLLRLLGWVRPYWRTFALGIVAMVVYAATEAALPALLKLLLDGSFVEKTPRFTNKITGSIFEELVALVAAGAGVDATNAIPVWDKKNKDAAPVLKTLNKDRLDGDGVIKVAGGVIAISETKAYAKNGGPTSTDKKKMGELVAPVWLTVIASIVAAVIIVLNVKLLFDWVTG